MASDLGLGLPPISITVTAGVQLSWSILEVDIEVISPPMTQAVIEWDGMG